MGHKDTVALHKIYEILKLYCKKYKVPYSFKVDTGSYETAIEFIEEKPYHPPISHDWSTKPIIFCPDLLDWYNKIIIEYEEEVGNRRSGDYLAKKGHHREGDMDTTRDSRRNKYYKSGGFRILRIWNSEQNWEKKLEDFLLKLGSK